MKQKGTITIFLCLVLVSISALICGLVESARIAGVRFYLQLAVDSAIDSLFSEYDNKLWEEYRLISGVFQNDEEIELGLSKYAKPYVEESGIYQMRDVNFEIMDRQMLTDEGGAWLEEEAYDYMKYKVVSDLILNSDPSDIWKQITEAKSMNKITSDYGLQSQTAIRLEKSLMRIGEHLAEQKQQHQKSMEALQSGNLSLFISHTNTLANNTGKVDSLVQQYSYLADKLERELVDVELSNKELWDDLSDANRNILEEQVSQFKPYIEKNGERRVEVEGLPQDAALTKESAEQATSLAEHIIEQKEAEENSAEDTDGDGIIDYYEEYTEYEEDMERLQEMFGSLHIANIGFAYGVEDEEAADVLSSLQSTLQGGVLELVIPTDRDVQRSYLETLDLPSNVDRTTRNTEDASLIKNILVNEYAIEHFPCFIDDAKKEFSYELEYIIEGGGKNEANLFDVVSKLVGIRSGLNYLHILSDANKMSQADTLANTIASAGGIPYLNFLIKFLIVAVWAMVEAVFDVKDLLAKEEVKLIKTAEDWHLSADKILDIGRDTALIKSGTFSKDGAKSEPVQNKDGWFRMDYKFYLRLLLFLQKPEDRNYRMMDLIQHNLAQSDAGFKVRDCMYSLRTKVHLEFASVFSNLGFVKGELGEIKETYSIGTETVKAY